MFSFKRINVSIMINKNHANQRKIGRKVEETQVIHSCSIHSTNI